MGNMIFFIVFALVLGAVFGYLIFYVVRKKQDESSGKKSAKIIEESERKKEKMLKEAQDEINKMQEEFKKEEKDMKNNITAKERKLIEKEEAMDGKLEELEKEKKRIEEEVENIDRQKKDLEKFNEKQMAELSAIAKLSQKEAEEKLFEKVEVNIKDDLLKHMEKVELEIKKDAKKKSQFILAEAMQRSASEIVSERTITLVELSSDDMKGRIIGKEGRNIHSFERVAGVDLVVDDTPGVIVISGFDITRRYIAKIALEKLLQDGRIHPTNIEKEVEKAKTEVYKHMKEIGERVTYELGITGLHPELIKIIGKLKFRVNYGQNLLKYSVEVVNVASHIAEELDADVNICKRGALLHYIGKAVDHEVEGHYSVTGKEIAKKYGVQKEVLHIIESCDGRVKPTTIEAIIVSVAHNIVQERPGAKRDGLESFVKRLKEIEAITMSFDGVESAYALKGGKEIRVMVKAEELDDMKSRKLAKNIANSIEKNSGYVGEIKVTLLRETHVIEYAC